MPQPGFEPRPSQVISQVLWLRKYISPLSHGDGASGMFDQSKVKVKVTVGEGIGSGPSSCI